MMSRMQERTAGLQSRLRDAGVDPAVLTAYPRDLCLV